MTDDPLAFLRARFRERCAEDLDRIRTLDPGDPELGSLAHRLAGSAGSFGYPAVSAAAAVVDEQAREGGRPDPAALQALIGSLEAILAEA